VKGKKGERTRKPLRGDPKKMGGKEMFSKICKLKEASIKAAGGFRNDQNQIKVHQVQEG